MTREDEESLRATTAGARALLEARALHFAYPAMKNAPDVVRGASLVIERGTLAALIGANGSGKSSLVRLLAGVLKPQSGEIFFDGEPLLAIEPCRRATRIAYVPQTINSVFPFTALEVVLTGRSPYAGRFRFGTANDEAIAREALRAVDASHLALRPVTELSGGERQMVALARALAQQPQCLLLDEPSSALDLKHRTALLRHLRRLRDEKAITALVVTHDLGLLDPAFDTVFAMRCGEVVAHGAPADVLQDKILADVYGDEHVRARRVFNRTFVWSEL